MRRKTGVGAIKKKSAEQEKYKDKGFELQESQLDQLSRQMEHFRVNLEDFAAKHRKDIKQDAQFRRHFQSMCAAIGVDPLTSSKGFWSVLGMGDFYYELAVQIIEVCMATSSKNGGLIGLEELRARLMRTRAQRKDRQEITGEDLRWAAGKLRVLEGGFSIVEANKGSFFVRSVPVELSMDHTMVLKFVSSLSVASVTVSIVQDQLNFQSERAQKTLDFMVHVGLAWVDKQSQPCSYWFPSMFEGCIHAQ